MVFGIFNKERERVAGGGEGRKEGREGERKEVGKERGRKRGKNNDLSGFVNPPHSHE